MSSSQQINATSAKVQATNEAASIPVAATIPAISAPVLPLGLSSVPTASVISPFATPVLSAGPRVTFPPSMAQFMNDPANLQAIQGFGQVMAMCQQNGGMPFLPSMFPFALPGAGTMPLQAPMAVMSFQTPMPQPSPFQPQLVSTMTPVNLAGALNAVGPSHPPQATDPQVTPDGHCVSIESDDGEWDIPRAHKKKKGKNIRPATSRNFAFEKLGDREEGQRKSAKHRLGQSVAHVSAFARLGEVREAEPARTRRSRSNRQEPQMEAKLERLEKKVGEKNDRDKPLAGSPFTTRVQLTPFPRKVKIDAPRFTGKEDPEIHLNSFNQSATMNGCTDEEKCILFFQTLQNRATEWFNKLRPGSIDSFNDLASKFKAKFQENCTKRKKFTYLSLAGQRESENLTSFLTRWKEEVDKVEEMDGKTVQSLLLNGLRAGELYKEFCRRPPATYQEAYHTAWEFAEAETQLRANREAEHGHKPKPVQVKKEEVPGPSRPRHHYDPVIRVVNTEECQEVRKAPVIPPENPTGQVGRQWSGTYCSYHRSDSHNTSECKSIKGVIRQMIDSGELGKDYLQKAQEKCHQWVRPTAPGNDRDNDRRRNNRPRERQPAPEKEHISMIFGGPEGGDSAAQRKNWVQSIYVGEVSTEPPRRKHTRREPIVFTDRDLPPTGEDHNDPLVITMDINGVDVARVLVDTGSSVNILYLETFQKLSLCRTQLEPLKTPLSGFTGDTVEAEGSILLPVELGSGEKTVWKKMRFIVVDIKCVHNAILGRPGINKVGAVISMPHLCMKFHTPGGVGEMKGDQRNARECYARAVKKMTRGVNVISQEITKGETQEKLEPEAETVEIELHPGDSSRMIRIGANLPEDLREQITRVLREYAGIFAWSVADMPGIDRSVICHQLAVREGSRPVRQKKRYLASDRRDFVKKEVSLNHLADMRATFDIMAKYNLRLNPKKCVFAVRTGKFLGFMMTKRGIEPNPEKIRAITEMQAPTSVRDVQKLTSRLAALSWFLSRSAERSLPFFKVLKKANAFAWDEECRRAFEELKEYLASDIVLSKPEPGETLYLYLGISPNAVTSVLIRDDGAQKPIYYVSKALNGAESRYTAMEKTAYALFISAKKLTSYFQAHPVEVLTDQPLGAVLRNSTSSGRMVKWAMMLTQFHIEYRPRSAIKGHALADFSVEMTGLTPDLPVNKPTELWWEMAVDGASGPREYGGGIVFTTPEGFKIYHAIVFNFKLTNNEAEYEALAGGLRLAQALKISWVSIKSDSSLIVGQVTGNMEAREGRMAQYKDLVLALLKGFEEFKIAQIPRAENADADLLSKFTQYAPEHVSKLGRVEILDRASIEKLEVAAITAGSQFDRSNLVGADDHWMYDLMEYLTDGSLPEQDDRARKVKLRAPRFQMLDGKLYKRAFGGPLLRCLTNREAERVIAEVHEGVCAAHQMSRTLSQRIILLGYYWPTIVQDCERYVQKCRTCQVFYKYPGRPTTYYHPVSNVIPFARFGVDIVGAFSVAQGGKKFVIKAIDYFTKWIEAEALANITTQQCKKFIWKNIITRFGAPINLITDNGPQFRNPSFTEYLEGFGIKHNRSSVAYPQGNGQVENANRTIVDGLKKQLEELPHIVWAFRVTPRRAHGETPFYLTYGCEARLPIEAEFPTFRESSYQPQQNEEDHLAELNLVEERRMAAEVKMSTYQQVVKKYHDNKVGPRYFQVGDEVLRRREASRPGDGGKLAKNWEGPYRTSINSSLGGYPVKFLGLESVGRGVSARAWRVATRVSRGQLEMLKNPSKALLDKGNDPPHMATRQLEDETSHLAPHQQHAPTWAHVGLSPQT
ncbi:unnamed protein product [Cuscuta campestris]|uniref:Integrase catalytic domain-containing protein n=1 Tax=Cuscuta campestris TaxID=132261 RepID=A0A484LEH0_9ASTE|nr:unnamed protein product [Cuscuta campestris]